MPRKPSGIVRVQFTTNLRPEVLHKLSEVAERYSVHVNQVIEDLTLSYLDKMVKDLEDIGK